MLIIMSSCEDKFTQVRTFDFPEHEANLAVTSLIREGKFPIIYISHSKGIEDNSEFEEIQNATAKFYRDDELRFNFLPFDNGRYVPDIVVSESMDDTIKIGHTYTIEVSSDEYETTTASQRLPLPPNITNMEYTIEGTVNDYGDKLDLLEIEIDDPGAESNFYTIELSAAGLDQNGNDIINGVYYESQDLLVEYGYRYQYIPDLTFNGKKYIIRLGIWPDWKNYFSSIDKLVARVSTVSRDYYLFDISKSLNEEAIDNPFVEPVLVHSNFSKGYGVFGLINSVEEEMDW